MASAASFGANPELAAAMLSTDIGALGGAIVAGLVYGGPAAARCAMDYVCRTNVIASVGDELAMAGGSLSVATGGVITVGDRIVGTLDDAGGFVRAGNPATSGIGTSGGRISHSDEVLEVVPNGDTNRGFGSVDEAFDAISDFRSRTTITDAQGGTGTVAVTEINGQRYFGVNSTNLSDADRNLGRQWRDRLGLTRGQDQVVFHAEAHSLMRAYERTNGNMPSNLTLYVDRNSCGVCKTYLPRMADEMGINNLNLSFTSGRSGVIRNGTFEWLD